MQENNLLEVKPARISFLQISVADRSERDVLAKFRMFKWESRIVDNVRVCVLCNAVECIEHLIDDCPGATGALRKKLHQVRLQMAVSTCI